MKIICLFIITLLSACISMGAKVDPKRLAEFEKGKTSYNQIITSLGKPTQTSILDDGNKKIEYIHYDAQATPASFIPFVGMFIGGVDTTTTSIALTFDKNDILKSYSSSQANLGKDGVTLGK